MIPFRLRFVELKDRFELLLTEEKYKMEKVKELYSLKWFNFTLTI